MRDLLDKYLPIVFWPVLIVLATWVSWGVITDEEFIGEGSIEVTNEPVDEIPPAVVDKPILQEISADGSITWTLYLDRIIREEDSIMELAKPRALYSLESGDVLEVTGELGTYDEEKRILTLTGDVKGSARNANFHFTVDQMIWDSNEGLLSATGAVKVTREGLLLSGYDLKFELAEGFSRLELSGGGGGVEVTSCEGALKDLNDLD